jgi:hypothetical protein
MANGYGGYNFGSGGLENQNWGGNSQSINPDPDSYYNYQQAAGMNGAGNGFYGRLGKLAKSPLGSMGVTSGLNMLAGGDPRKALMGSIMGTGQNELLKYGLKQGLGTALGGQALGALGGPLGMAAMAASPFLMKGISGGIGRLFGGGNRGPSQQELAMGEAKGNLMGMRGTYGSDVGAGQALRDKYNPMLENQIGRMQELADRGLSSEYNTRQMAGAAANTEAARRAAESRMRATGGMLGGGQALAGYGGINQAAVGGMAQGAYNAAQNNMNQQPGYIQALAGMAGSQINRGDNYYNQGRQGMMGLDQNLYNLNAQEKARADAMSQNNRDREAMALGGIANLAGTAMGMEQSRGQFDDMMKLYGDGAGMRQMGDGFTNQGPMMQNPDFGGVGLNPQGNYDVQAGAGSGYRPEISGGIPELPYEMQVPGLFRNSGPRLPGRRFPTNVPGARLPVSGFQL